MISKRDMLAQAIDRTGFGRLLERTGTWSGLLVFNYHRIGEPGETLFDRGLWSATAEDFDLQVAHLCRRFDLVGLEDLGDVFRRRSGRHVMITFDDGYRDNYELAFPILRSHRAAATFFVTTGFIDDPSVAWWDEIAWMARSSRAQGIDVNKWTIEPVRFDATDREPAIRRLLSTYTLLEEHETGPYLDFLADATGSGRCPRGLGASLWMDWDMLREMHAGGMSIGSHTVTHPVLANLPAHRQTWEVGHSRARIEREIGATVEALSYPVGGPSTYDSATWAALERHRYRFAFSDRSGFQRWDEVDRFRLPRVAVEHDVAPHAFRAIASLPHVFA